eukprot:s2450_g10.t1
MAKPWVFMRHFAHAQICKVGGDHGLDICASQHGLMESVRHVQVTSHILRRHHFCIFRTACKQPLCSPAPIWRAIFEPELVVTRDQVCSFVLESDVGGSFWAWLISPKP